jgi:hypothetical protein
MLSRGGEALLTTTEAIDVVGRLIELGIDNPLPLIDAAHQGGVVDIEETADRKNPGG